jgi:WD40 repeat protein
MLLFASQRELLPVADLPVAKCSVARYSHGGALLAAVGLTHAVVIYPAYYGSGGGASGATPSVGGSSSHYAQRSSAGDSGRGSGGYSSAAAAAAASGIGTDGACVIRPLLVLKAHVSTVTDLVFSGDDKRLVSSGAGGAVYFWDMSTGARLMELEYVDKQCVYYTGGF